MLKSLLGAGLISIGLLGIAAVALNPQEDLEIKELISSCAPGWLFLCLGLVIQQGPRATTGASLRENGTLGMIVGAGLLLTASSIGRLNLGIPFLGVVVAFLGWSILVLGCVSFSRWKGYKGWFGLFGYLLVPGILVLLCLPNRRSRWQALTSHRRDFMTASELRPFQALAELSAADEDPGYRFFLATIPLAVYLAGVSLYVASFGWDVSPAEWRPVVHAELGFRALMPGPPTVEEQEQETPAGRLVCYAFNVQPRGKKDLFSVFVYRLPQSTRPMAELEDQLFANGRQMAASQGQVVSEQPIELDGHRGVEIEVRPANGGALRARFYVAKGNLYLVSVFASRIRLASQDVQRFFDSFSLHLDAA